MPNIFTIYPQHFLVPESSETLKGSFTKFFGTVRPKIFDGKTWFPLLCIKFWYPKFSEPLKGWPRNFSALWDQKFLTEKRDTPFSSIKLFETRNFLNNSRIPLRNCSALWDMKISTVSRDMPPLIHKFFSIPKTFWKTEGFIYKDFCFGPVRQKISTKPWCLLSYAWKFSIKNFLWNTKVFSNEIFCYGKTKTFRQEIVIPPPLWSIKTFSLPEIFWNTEWFPGEVFSVLWDKKKFRQNREASPLLCLKIFDTTILSKHRSVLLRILLALWAKNFERKVVIPPLLHKI